MRGTRRAETRDEQARERSRAKLSTAKRESERELERWRELSAQVRERTNEEHSLDAYLYSYRLRNAANERVGNARVNNLLQTYIAHV